MILLPSEIAATIPKLYEQEAKGEDVTVHVKFFDPCSQWSWYVTEFDGVDSFFGLVVGHDTEFGYFSLAELQQYQGPLKIGIERDLFFKPCSLKIIKDRLGSN